MADAPYFRHGAAAALLCRSAKKRNGQEAFGFRQKIVRTKKIAKRDKPASEINFPVLSSELSSSAKLYSDGVDGKTTVMRPIESAFTGISAPVLLRNFQA